MYLWPPNPSVHAFGATSADLSSDKERLLEQEKEGGPGILRCAQGDTT